MEIFQIAGIGIIATILIIILKQTRPEFTLLVSIVTGVIIFAYLLPKLSYVIDTISSLSSRVNVDISYFDTLIKIIGIAYIVEFASQICRDAGQDAIAMKVELGGKVIIMVLAIPVLLALLDLIIKILP
ncbi:MAG: stage III sporulation protein AD [Tissierellia bacterium]|nr:stage III sporulation protein AD [Tissierellia bacterium]MDD4726151.1 stage III sporulation protein AD [Tissierellia bacterium]